STELTHRQPGKQLGAELDYTRERALQHQPAQRLAEGQFARHAAAQRFAESDNVRGGKSLLLQPAASGLRVQVSSLLTRRACAPTIAAVVECKHVEPGLQQQGVAFDSVADVPAVAMTKHYGEVCARRVALCRKKPAIEFGAIGGREI